MPSKVCEQGRPRVVQPGKLKIHRHSPQDASAKRDFSFGEQTVYTEHGKNVYRVDVQWVIGWRKSQSLAVWKQSLKGTSFHSTPELAQNRICVT
jgi:hypothetical protein